MKSFEQLQEQYCIGTALATLAQRVDNKKLAAQLAQQGLSLAGQAQQHMAEIADECGPLTPIEWFEKFLEKNGLRIPKGGGHIYEISAKPLPPSEALVLSNIAALDHLNFLYEATEQEAIRSSVGAIGLDTYKRIADEVPFCGTGPSGRPHVGGGVGPTPR